MQDREKYERDFGTAVYQIESKSKTLATELLQFIARSDINKICYAYKARSKSPDSIFDKLQDRIEGDNPDYTATDITDYVGIRFVTLFRRDMPLVAEKVMQFIAHENGCPIPNVFIKNSCEEAIIYASKPESDGVLIRTRDIIKEKSSLQNVELNTKRTSYSSIHLVARLCSHDSPEPIRGCGTGFNVPVEIQIRTVFEDAWGEIDHQILYKKDHSGPEQTPSIISEHVAVLKNFADSCAKYADVIKEHIDPSEYSQRSTNKVHDSDPDNFTIERLKENKIPDYIISEFESARNKRKRAEDSPNKKEAERLYLEAVEELVNIETSLTKGTTPEIQLSDTSREILIHHLQLDRALCLLSEESPRSINQAQYIYEELEIINPENPLIKFRLAQAYERQNENSKALIKLEDAASKLVTCESTTDHKESSLKIADYEEKYLQTAIPKLVGYLNWKLADNITKSSCNKKDSILIEALNHLELAYKSTKEALEVAKGLDDKQRSSLHNNLLYYASNYVEIDKNGGFAQSGISPSAVEEHINILLGYIESMVASSNIGNLETVAYAYNILGDYSECNEITSKIQELIWKDDSIHDASDSEVQTILRSCYRLNNPLGANDV